MKKTIVAVLFLSVLLPYYTSVKAATSSITTLSGRASLGVSYDSNVDRTSDDEDDRWEPTINGTLSLVHSKEGEKGGLSLNTGHTFTYNFRTEDTTWSDFYLSLIGNRDLSKRLRWNFSERVVRSNDQWGDYSSSSTTRQSNDDEDRPSFSDRNARQKFWTNFFSTGLNYQYSRYGTVTLGYANRILEYDNSDANNYIYHQPSISTSYQFTDQWHSSLSYSYKDADFEDSQDSVAHSAGFNLGYTRSVWNSFSAGLNYYDEDYDTDSTEKPDDEKNDYTTVSGNLGWTHSFSPTRTLLMSAGPSYVDRDEDNDKTAANFNVNYTSEFENGSWFVGANGGFDDRSFYGDVEEDLSEYKRAATGISWQVAKNLSASLGASFRDDEFLNSTEGDEERYNANAILTYNFMRWFSLSGRYMYTQVVADDSDDEYKDHFFFITLSASKELKRWIHQ